MCTVSFKERVKNEAIANASLYQSNFIDYEYLVCSEAFNNGYHVIKSVKGSVREKLQFCQICCACLDRD